MAEKDIILDIIEKIKYEIEQRTTDMPVTKDTLLANIYNSCIKIIHMLVDEQQKKGQWLYDRPGHYKCSECGYMEGRIAESEYRQYCPACGAKMNLYGEVPYREHIDGSIIYKCPRCKNGVGCFDNYCRHCANKLRWETIPKNN